MAKKSAFSANLDQALRRRSGLELSEFSDLLQRPHIADQFAAMLVAAKAKESGSYPAVPGFGFNVANYIDQVTDAVSDALDLPLFVDPKINDNSIKIQRGSDTPITTTLFDEEGDVSKVQRRMKERKLVVAEPQEFFAFLKTFPRAWHAQPVALLEPVIPHAGEACMVAYYQPSQKRCVLGIRLRNELHIGNPRWQYLVKEEDPLA